MKLVITDYDGKETVYNEITDLFIAYRQFTPADVRGTLQLDTVIASRSWGSNVRELVKEVQQALVELQDYLRERRHVNRS